MSTFEVEGEREREREEGERERERGREEGRGREREGQREREEVSGSIPDRTLTQGLKIIGEKLHNDPRAVFCAMGHMPFPMLTVQFGGQHVALLCSMMNKVPGHHSTKCAWV